MNVQDEYKCLQLLETHVYADEMVTIHLFIIHIIWYIQKKISHYIMR